MSDEEEATCTCGHELEDHLVRVRIPENVYGPCRRSTPVGSCPCTEYEADE